MNCLVDHQQKSTDQEQGPFTLTSRVFRWFDVRREFLPLLRLRGPRFAPLSPLPGSEMSTSSPVSPIVTKLLGSGSNFDIHMPLVTKINSVQTLTRPRFSSWIFRTQIWPCSENDSSGTWHTPLCVTFITFYPIFNAIAHFISGS